MSKYKIRSPRKSDAYSNRDDDCEQAIEPVFMDVIDAAGIKHLSHAGLALIIEQALDAGWAYHEIVAALVQLAIRATGIPVARRQTPAKDHIGGAAAKEKITDITKVSVVDPPKLPPQHTGRHTECVHVLELPFLQFAKNATRAGWKEDEVAIALAEIAVRQMHGFKRKPHEGLC